MCLTYGRPHLLEEAIQCFLRQDYAGTKELIVLNDFSEQFLEFPHPEVVIVNCPKRFRTVGEKRNACAALTSHELLFVWDDDDIYLPHRLRFSVQMLNPEKGFFKPSKAWTLNNGIIGGPNANLYHSGACFTKDLFDRAHGYAHMGSGQDMDLELAFERIIGKGKNYNAIKPNEIYYLYRWGGTESYHLSGFGKDKPYAPTGNDRVAEYVQRVVATGKIPTGVVSLSPTWRRDYSELVRKAIDLLAK